jgi:hypothetical protein
MINLWNWYWVVAGDDTKVWSSRLAGWVPSTDADYVAWVGDDQHVASYIGSMAELYEVFAQQFPRGSPRTYAADARYRKASGGLTITGISTSAPFLTDPTSRNTLANWKMSDGTFIQLSPQQLTTAANAIANFVQACFTCEAQLVAGIDGGTITTLDQIDTAFAAISNTVTGLMADEE